MSQRKQLGLNDIEFWHYSLRDGKMVLVDQGLTHWEDIKAPEDKAASAPRPETKKRKAG